MYACQNLNIDVLKCMLHSLEISLFFLQDLYLRIDTFVCGTLTRMNQIMSKKNIKE